MRQFEFHCHEQSPDVAIQKAQTSSLPERVKDLIETGITALGAGGSVIVSCTGHEDGGRAYHLRLEVRASADLAFPAA